MRYEAINFSQKFKLFDERWKPKVIAEMNDYQFKVVRLEGDFIWHDHNKSVKHRTTAKRRPSTKRAKCRPARKARGSPTKLAQVETIPDETQGGSPPPEDTIATDEEQ
jgi:hypothetical protein